MDPHDRVKNKILTRTELLARRHAARDAGKTLVQCHGCFDIVHPGHVRHLQHAARQGDLLLVTITGDSVMSKGHGRPLIPQELRAENLAALDCVDFVYTNPHATAEELLEEVRPDVYVKGREYEINRDPRFQAERTAVERHGGRIVFSSGDVVFSSTALVAAIENAADPAHARIKHLIEQHDLTPERLEPIIEGFLGLRVCVIGETITDTYVFCDRPDIAGESPVMSLRPLEQRSYDGGAAVIARHLAAFGARPTLVTALPRTLAAEALRARLTAEGIEVVDVESDGPMLEKQRFLVGTQKVMKLDLVQPVTLDAARRDRFVSLAADAAKGCTAAIVADFGNGLLTAGVLNRLIPLLRRQVEFLAGDVSGRRSSLSLLRSMDLLTPTEAELRDAVHDWDESLNAAVWKVLEYTNSRCAFVTMGAEGLIAFERLPEARGREAWSTRIRAEHVPALTPHALDALGCGDALLAAATLTMASAPALTDSLAIGAFLSSIAAGAHAARLGNDPVSARDLRAGLRRLVDSRIAVVTARPGVRLAV
jgi:rfaE bifunctional protein nucleotidyltransferase chain/domain